MKVEFLEYKVDTFLNDSQFCDNLIFNTLNPHSYCTAKKDNEFKYALQKSDVLLPDGIGIILAAKLLNKPISRRITGYELHKWLLEKANPLEQRIFYLGSNTETLKKIALKLKIEFPKTTIDYYSPPFKNRLTESDNELIIEKINQFSPDILFVGMTAPKQEKWVEENKDRLNSMTIASIGAVFDFYAGTKKRAPRWILDLNCEWLFRLVYEPQRMWKRYLVNNIRFIYYVLKSQLNRLFF